MVYTSYFSKQAKQPIQDNMVYASIAVGLPKFDLPFELKHITAVKPWGIFGKYEGEEWREKYRERLNKIGVKRIFEAIQEAKGNKENIVLMCFERNAGECHRREFADWWFEKTGEIIEEL